MPNPLVIYHGSCQDGFTAAWACWLKNPDWEYFPATHGNPPTDVIGRDVYMLDFSYKRPVLEEMDKVAKSIVILDHHASAQKDLSGMWIDRPDRRIIFDMGKSGVRLAWEYFHPKSRPPMIVTFVEDRDLWRFQFEDTKAISAVMFSHPYDFGVWSSLYIAIENPEMYAGLVKEGEAIDRKHLKDVKELVARMKMPMVIGGVEVPTANLPYTYSSEAGHQMAEGAPFAACYYDTPEGREFSLRSRPNGIDVSEIAKLYGGGGHKNAAGFRLKPGQSLELTPMQIAFGKEEN